MKWGGHWSGIYFWAETEEDEKRLREFADWVPDKAEDVWDNGELEITETEDGEFMLFFNR